MADSDQAQPTCSTNSNSQSMSYHSSEEEGEIKSPSLSECYSDIQSPDEWSMEEDGRQTQPSMNCTLDELLELVD